MKVLIDIPDKDYDKMCKGELVDTILFAVKNGIPLTPDTLADLPVEITPTQKWIPVSEGLPEEHEWLGTKRFKTTISDFVYVTFETPNGTKFTDYIRLQNGKPSISKQFELDAISKDIKLTAWMLPPKPYEGKQSNKVGWLSLENVREKVERGSSDDMD